MSILTKNYKLNINRRWYSGGPVPSVKVSCRRSSDMMSFAFDVTEPPECFRLECCKDGDPCWQDSCVEVFIEDRLGNYYNFETNAAGCTLAEVGHSRHGRTAFSPEQYCALRRELFLKPEWTPSGMIHWAVQISFHLDLFGLGPFDPAIGNLYKCASYAQCPQYLCAYSVDTPEPDFHQPPFFRNLFL